MPVLDDIAEGALKLLFHFSLTLFSFTPENASCMSLPLDGRNLVGTTIQMKVSRSGQFLRKSVGGLDSFYGFLPLD
jgi:hypothetical protein